MSASLASMELGHTSMVVLDEANFCEIRRLGDLRNVLHDTEYCTNDRSELCVYKIYRDCAETKVKHLLFEHNLRYDVTVMSPLLLGEEYVKTRGHYHEAHDDVGALSEAFEVLRGEGAFLMHKKHAGEITEAKFLIAREGEKILVPSDYGHVIINSSSSELAVGNLVSRGCVQTYNEYEKNRGAPFYLLTGGRYVRNPHYPWISGLRLLKRHWPRFMEGPASLLEVFMKNPDCIRFLNDSGIQPFDSPDTLECHQIVC